MVSGIAAIPKDQDSVRLIHDGSRPVGAAMCILSHTLTASYLLQLTVRRRVIEGCDCLLADSIRVHAIDVIYLYS